MSNGSIAPGPDLADSDEAYGSDESQSTCSISSSIYDGLVENGRRYQNYRPGYSFVPSDERQFETYEAGHVVALLMESNKENCYFRAPIGPNPQHVLDIGTGQGNWAIEVADIFPSAIVRGVDLYPPPATWVPPNCIFEVDDISREWTWQDPFDLIHMRILEGAFTREETRHFYQQCFKGIRPGGWIEQLEIQPQFFADDHALPEDSILGEWSRAVFEASVKSGRPMELFQNYVSMIEQAGFVDVHVKECKWPIGSWSSDPLHKEAGRINLQHWHSGVEGYSMHLLTNYGEPTPWSWEGVMAFVAKFRKELTEDKSHIYHFAKRVWARKPVSKEEGVGFNPGTTKKSKNTMIDTSVSSECPF